MAPLNLTGYVNSMLGPGGAFEGQSPYQYTTGAVNPLYNAETGWADASQMDVINQINGYSSNVNNGGGGNNWMSPFENMATPQGQQYVPNTGTGLYPGMAQSPGYTTSGGGTNTPPPAQIASPSLMANSMGMQGAENVGGMGMYTGTNAPLDLSRFTPAQGQQQNGPPPGSIPTGDPNTWITPWGATYNTPGTANNATSADYDAWRQRTYGNMMGPQGRGPNSNPYAELTDALVRQPGSINAQTFQGYLGSLQQNQTGPYPPQQTAPRPPQNGGQPQYSQYNGAQFSPNSGTVAAHMTGYNPNYGQQGGNSQRPGQPGQQQWYPGVEGQRQYTSPTVNYDPNHDPSTAIQRTGPRMWGGQVVDEDAVAAYMKQRYADQQRQGGPGQPGQSPVIGSPGMMGRPGQMQVDPAMGGPFDTVDQIRRRTDAAYGPGAYDALAGMSPQQYSQMFPGTASPQQMAAQFSSDPAAQQAYLRDMFGGGQQQQNPYQNQQPDFRAATFGGGSLFPAPAGGSGSTNIPNTTNPSTSQYSSPQVGWGGASNRRSGFGGMSLFGNGFGSGMGGGNMGGQTYGQPASRYRGAGSYGRPASYGGPSSTPFEGY